MQIEPTDVRPIIISGPSGVGKGRLVQMLNDAHPVIFTRTVSHTTRQPRASKTEGSMYFYVSEPEFESHLKTPSSNIRIPVATATVLAGGPSQTEWQKPL
ncbi:P-loop containing nucleoside triphosphate hydrolase protein [Trichoderma novae-zelandiae]